MPLASGRLSAFALRYYRSLTTPNNCARSSLHYFSRYSRLSSQHCARFHFSSANHAQPASHDEGVLLHLDHQSQSSIRSTLQNSTVDNGKRSIPVACPGCGALSQNINQDEPGYYTRSRKAIKAYLNNETVPISARSNVEASTLSGDEGLEEAQNSQSEYNTEISHFNQPVPPVCDRCHDLIYNNKGQSIAHPTVDDLVDSIAESPFRQNHIYHVLDAADFPMSLIPKVFKSLDLAKPRSQNRRARTKFASRPTVSFVITRSDLLGQSKDMVDKMMPYFRDVLRDALGREGRNIRLGNVHLVSAKRGWWTKEIKDDIWERGGGNWMVGKANVGKSNLFPVLFPKGSGERAPVYAEIQDQSTKKGAGFQSSFRTSFETDADSLLPPAQPEMAFPAMPVVSHLPGTTASPIRLPFGNHKGELIDLPGLERGNLEKYISADHKHDLVMQYRPNVEQYIIKPGQSLLLGGGLVQIRPDLDPNDRSATMLAYPFVPLDVHVTADEKAERIRVDREHSNIKSILDEGAYNSIRSGGFYSLRTNVTKVRAGPLLRAGVPMSKLPFRVYSTDILIEGIGWIELVCQVRRQKRSLGGVPHASPEHNSMNDAGNADTLPVTSQPDDMSTTKSDFTPFGEDRPVEPVHSLDEEDGFVLPKVEIFSPNGGHIAQRQSLGAWTIWSEHRQQHSQQRQATRPRKSMKGAKKREKAQRRAVAAAVVS